ncbi:MAG: hemolysin D [Piscirickettsiaceae bacterium]|nr:MAG: hemolysin D [Piscirickettsiaceae bacterium]PCI65906.1 MAG: hemolysin D [Piscirickettsiaceae bacterium]
MKKKAIIVSLLILVIAGFVFFNKQQTAKTSTELILYGNIDIREVQLTVNGSEHIAMILVQEGDRVKKGQLLATLQTELLDAQLAEIQALFEGQQQVVARLKAGSRPQEVAKAKAEHSAAKSLAKTARDTAKRLRQLLPRNLASTDDVEISQSKADTTTAQAEAARQAWLLAVEGPRKEDIAIAEAVLRAKQAALMLAKQRLDDANLYSPSNGIIRNRILEVGDMVTPQSAILTLALTDPVWVRAYLPETELGHVAAGFNAEISSDSFPGKRYQGWVGYISPTAEFTPKNVQTPELRTRLVYSVRVYACNDQNELRLGMPVTVTIPLRQNIDVSTSNRCNAHQ